MPMESEEDSAKKASHRSCPLTNIAEPSRTARDTHINKDVPAQGVPSLKPGRIPAELAEKAKAFGLCVNKEAQRLADQYGKSLASVMTAAGLSTKATWNESIWNLHQAWYASTNPKASDGRSLIFSYLLMLMQSQNA